MAVLIKNIVGYQGKLILDPTKPDGAPYKVMNVKKLKEIFDWTPQTKLEDGISQTIQWYYDNVVKIQKEDK